MAIGTLSLLLSLFGACGKSVGPGKTAKIVAINGLYYKGEMGDAIPDTVLQFAVADKNNNYIPNQQIQLFPLEGDGELSHRSIITDSLGLAGFWYAFTGDSGHAVIRLVAEGIDSLDILLRANTLIPGPGGQGQYVLLTDTYAEVKGFNGPPQSIDTPFPNNWLVVVNYESSLGLAVLINDVSHNKDADDFEDVLAIAVNTVYDGTTLDSIPIRIGSPFADVRTVYGDPNEIVPDSDTTGPFLRICYENLETEFIGDLDPDTTIIEIDLVEGLKCEKQ